MRIYGSKTELKEAIKDRYEKYIAEFNDIADELKDLTVIDADRTPSENLAYQVGWTTLLLQWERDEKSGVKAITPSKYYKWNQLGELYQWFNKEYALLTLGELKKILDSNVHDICMMIDNMSEDELFAPHMRNWADDATKNAVWEVYKFIHINTVAPFNSFRSKIRKWKRSAINN